MPEIEEETPATAAKAKVDAELEKKRTGEWKTEEGLKKVAEFIREHIKNRNGVLNENRCDYFKGDRLTRVLLPEVVPEGGKKKIKKRPKILESIVDAKEANLVAQTLLASQEYYIKVQVMKDPANKQPQKEVRVMKQQAWDEMGYYVWVWDGNPFWNNVFQIAMVVIFILVTCFPIWPDFMKLGLWYISVTLLVVMFVFLTIRFLLFLFVWIFGFEFWILPNLFDESLTVVESFKPVFMFERIKTTQLWWRLGISGGFIWFIYWAYTQPTEFDEFIKGQKEFVDDLYEGNLLSDVSQQHKTDLDKIFDKMPSIEDLLADLAHEEDDEEGAGSGTCEGTPEECAKYHADEAPREENMQPEDFEENEEEELDMDAMLEDMLEADEAEDIMDEMMDEQG